MSIQERPRNQLYKSIAKRLLHKTEILMSKYLKFHLQLVELFISHNWIPRYISHRSFQKPLFIGACIVRNRYHYTYFKSRSDKNTKTISSFRQCVKEKLSTILSMTTLLPSHISSSLRLSNSSLDMMAFPS